MKWRERSTRSRASVKEAVGELNNDEQLRNEGEAEQDAGAVEEAFGKGRRKVGEAINDSATRSAASAHATRDGARGTFRTSDIPTRSGNYTTAAVLYLRIVRKIAATGRYAFESAAHNARHMAERCGPAELTHDPTSCRRPRAQPQTRNELQAWVREHLHLPPAARNVAARRPSTPSSPGTSGSGRNRSRKRFRRCRPASPTRWRTSRPSCRAKDATVSSISRYFEQLVADLTDKSHRDPKTKLMNFGAVHRAARVVPRARAARPLVRGRPRRHHRLQVVQRRARPRGRRSHHRARRGAAARTGAVRRPARAGAASARRTTHAEGSARAVRRRRVLLPHSGSRRVPPGVRRRRALSRSGRALRLDARGSPSRRAAGARRRRRRLPVARTRRRSPLHRATPGRRI